MADTGKDLDTEIRVGVNADAVDTGTARAKRSLSSLGEEAQKVGDQAGKGLDKIRVSGEEVAKSTERVTKNVAAGLQRQIAAYEAGGTASRQYQESLARLRGADMNALRPLLDQLDAAKTKAEGAKGATDSWSASLGRLGPALGTIFAGVTFAGFVGKLVAVQREIDILNSSLTTVAGGSAAAEREMEWLKTFAKETPFGLAQATQGFVKMKALGLDPTRASLTSFGNTAAAMGKDLNQMIEAVADASTSEFERLKEFGIKAKQDGDQVSLTFQGITKTIGNNSKEIVKYLEDIGNTQFAGAMELRAKTLDGIIAGLGDSWDELFRTINQGNAGSLIFDSVKLASSAIEDATTIIRAMTGATADLGRETGALTTLQGGLATVFETVAVLGANLGYVLSQTGDTLGGLASLYQQFFSFNFEGARAVADSMRENGRAARAEIDATEQRIMGARKAQEEYAQWATRNAAASTDPRRVDLLPRSTSATPSGPSKADIAAAKKDAEELQKIYAELAGVTSSYYTELAAAQRQLGKGAISQQDYVKYIEELIQKQPFAVALQKKASDAAKEEAKAVDELAKAYGAKVKEQQQSTKSVADQVTREWENVRMMGLSKEAVAELLAVKYEDTAASRDRAAAVEEESDSSSSYAKSLREEANALRNLAAAKREGAAKQAYLDAEAEIKESGKRAEQEWQKTIDNIDGVFRQGFADMLNGGENAWDAFTKSLRTTFMTTVADEIYKALAKPFVVNIAANMLGMNSAGGVLGALAGGGGAGGGGGVLGLANNASSLYSAYNNAGSYLETAASWLGLGGSAAALGALSTGVTGLGAVGMTSGLSTLGSASYGIGSGLGGLGLNAGNAALGAGYSFGATGSTLVANSAGGLGTLGSQAGMLGGTIGTGTTVGAGAGGAAAGGFSAASAIPIIGWIIAAIAASNTMYGKGYSVKGVDTGVDYLVNGGVTTRLNQTFNALGISEKWADILSGGPLIDKAFDVLGISTGERRYGGQYGYSFDGTSAYNPRQGVTIGASGVGATFLEGPSGGMFAEDDVKKLIDTTVTGINSIFKALESDAQVTGFNAGLEVSANDKGGVFAGGRLSTGAAFGEAGTGKNPFEGTSDRSPNAQKAIQNFAVDMQQVTIQALQAATDIPKSIQEYLKQFDAEKLTTEEIEKVLTEIGSRAAVIGEFRDALKTLPFDNLKALSYDTAESLIAAAGGLDVLNAGLSGYFQNFYSEAERAAVQTAAVTRAITDLGLQMPDLADGSEAARVQFRALVEAQDVTTDAGRANYVALLGIQSAFADLTPVVDQTAAALRGAEEAARAAQAAIAERTRLEDQLLSVQGNTAELRQRELDRLMNDENRGLQQQIWDTQDAQSAAAEAARAQAAAASAYESAASSAASAAEQVREAWQSVGDSLVDEVKRIRGEIVGTGNVGFAYAQSQFALATAQARANDQDAAASLPELSRQVIDLYAKNATSALDLQLFRSQIAASLIDTDKLLGRNYGITVPNFNAGTTIAPSAFNPYIGGGSAGATEEVAQLRADFSELRELLHRAASASETTADMLVTVTRGGKAMVTA